MKERTNEARHDAKKKAPEAEAGVPLVLGGHKRASEIEED